MSASSTSAGPQPQPATQIEAGGLDQALWRLSKVSELGQGLLAEPHLRAARELQERAGQRRRLAPSLTVGALLGATGSGKSSLLNALVGAQVARTAVTRPTTTRPLAALPSLSGQQAGQAADLLDWLEVDERVDVSGAGGTSSLGAGTILVDLPDIDSDAREHRVIAERMAQMVDVLIWVLDPQKYADALVHNEFLRPMREHAHVTVVVLNQVDRLNQADREAVLADLSRLLATEGLEQVPVLAASAHTGEGLEELRTQVQQVAQARKAHEERLAADLRSWAGGVSRALDLPSQPPGSRMAVTEHEGWRSLREAAYAAAGAGTVTQAVASSYRRSAQVKVGWIPLRWLARLRRDPLGSLHLRKGRPQDQEAKSQPEVVGRSSLPEPSATVSGRLRTSAHNWAGAVVAPLPAQWAAEALARSDERASQLPDALDQAVVRTDLGLAQDRGWWRAANWLQWLLLLVALVGGGWLLVTHLAHSYLLIEIAPPRLGRVPYPSLLLLAGLGAGLLAGLVGTVLAGAGARRASAKAARRLRQAVDEVVERDLAAPFDAELDSWHEMVSLVAQLRS